MSSVIEVLKEDKDHIVTAITLLNSCKNDKIIVEKSLNQAIVALEKQENYVIDFIRLEVLPKSKKEQFRVFFKDGSEQVFEKKRVGEQK